MLRKLSNRRLSKTEIIDRLDEIIAIALPEMQNLSCAEEIAFKLIPAVAIACLTTYLILFNRSSWELPTNLAASAGYCFGMLVLGIFVCIKSKKMLRHINGIATIIGFVWLLLHLGKIPLPMNSFLSLLYTASLFVSTLAIIFSLVNSVYATPHYTGTFSFDKYRYLAIAKLTKFSAKEINLAIFDSKIIRDRLHRKIDIYLLSATILTMLLWILSVSLSSIVSFNSGLYVIYGSIGSILLSATIIFILIDNMRSSRKSDRCYLYRLILLKYDIEKLKFTNSLLRTKLN